MQIAPSIDDASLKPGELNPHLGQRNEIKTPEVIIPASLMESLKKAGYNHLDDISWCSQEDIKLLADGNEALITSINRIPKSEGEPDLELRQTKARLITGMPKCTLVNHPGEGNVSLFDLVSNSSSNPAEVSQKFNQSLYGSGEVELYIKPTGIKDKDLKGLDLDSPSKELRHQLQTAAFKESQISNGDRSVDLTFLGASAKQVYTQITNSGTKNIRYLQKKFDVFPPKTILGELKPGEFLIKSGDVFLEMGLDPDTGNSTYVKVDQNISPLSSVLADNLVKNGKEVLQKTQYEEINGTQIAEQNKEVLSDYQKSSRREELTQVLDDNETSTSLMSGLFDMAGLKKLRKLTAKNPYGCTYMMNLSNRIGIRLIQEGLEGGDKEELLPHIEGDGGYSGCKQNKIPDIKSIMKIQAKMSMYKKVFKYIFSEPGYEIKNLDVSPEIQSMAKEARFYFKTLMEKAGNPEFEPSLRMGFNIMNTATTDVIDESSLTSKVDDVYIYDLPEYKDNSKNDGVGDLARLIMDAGQQMVNEKTNPEFDLGIDLKTLEIIITSSVQDLDYKNNPEIVKEVLQTVTLISKDFFKKGLFEYRSDAKVIAGKRKIEYGKIKGFITTPEIMEDFLSQVIIRKREIIDKSYSNNIARYKSKNV